MKLHEKEIQMQPHALLNTWKQIFWIKKKTLKTFGEKFKNMIVIIKRNVFWCTEH